MAKKQPKLVVPKAASPDALALADQLLEIAPGDLQAALVLHGASRYAQAIFFLQQGVEKIGKAYGLAMGLAEPAELQKDWSHNTLKHSEVFADYGEQQGLTSTGMAPDKVKAFIEELKNPDKVTGAMMAFLVEWAVSLVQQHDAYKKDPNQRARGLSEMTTWAVGTHTDPAAVAKATALAEYLVDFSAESSLILPTTVVLGIATAPHAVISRYPAGGVSPAKRYGAEYPVVVALPKLCLIAEALASSVRVLCELAPRLQPILAMPGGDVSADEKH